MFSSELCSTDQTAVVFVPDHHVVKQIQGGNDKAMCEANLAFDTSLKETDDWRVKTHLNDPNTNGTII